MRKRNLYFAILSVVVSTFCTGQPVAKKLEQAPWQQYVRYVITVELDDEAHLLRGNETVIYKNHSPHSLSEVYFHLWPNAYKNNQTAFARQHLENGKVDFHFAKPDSRGWIDSLDFRVDSSSLKWEFMPDIDICRIRLDRVLDPGDSIRISTPFKVKIPDVYSRMGHEGQLYCITQWYPKPAVYDVNGWNPMPYLDQGEFYSEFGDFDVSITLPKNYVLAATGELQNQREKEWLEQLASRTETAEDIPSSKEKKTLRYVQSRVHDFAWFCSKEFNVRKSYVTLKSGRTVDTWLFAKAKSIKREKEGLDFINDAVKFYSEKVGEYPYSLAQVVITPLKAGGGMEYPTITNCESIGRTVIVHEVGHNWFYGILGSNEREHPWMDESINTYYENRSTEEERKYEPAGKEKGIEELVEIDLKGFGQSKLLYLVTARANTEQAGNLHSAEFSDGNYGAIVYAKNPLSFRYLQAYLGDSLFDAMMHSYYETWKFRHPLPGDFRKHAETVTGKNLNWFFDDLLGSNKKPDYSITSIRSDALTLKNKTGLASPLSLSAMNGDKELKSIWIEGFTGTKQIDLKSELSHKNQLATEYYRIDAGEQLMDVCRHNNTARLSGLCKTGAPMQIKFFPAFENASKRRLFLYPAFGWNLYNHGMLGVGVFNDLIPAQRWDFDMVPLYSFATSDVNGYLNLAHNIFPSQQFHKWSVGVNIARFASYYFFRNTTYEKISPYVRYKWGTGGRNPVSHSVELRNVLVNEQARTSDYFKNFDQAYSFTNVYYTRHNEKTLYPSVFQFHFQNGFVGESFNKLSAEFTQDFVVTSEKEKPIRVRAFAGSFIGTAFSKQNIDIERVYYQGGGTPGMFDYQFEQAQFGRGENNYVQSIFAAQVVPGNAGFRSWVRAGQTDKWLTALNLTLPFPGKMPVAFYADAMYYDRRVSLSTVSGTTINYEPTLTYSGGIAIIVARDMFEIYLPLFASDDVGKVWEAGNTSLDQRVTFMFNLGKLNLLSEARKFKI